MEILVRFECTAPNGCTWKKSRNICIDPDVEEYESAFVCEYLISSFECTVCHQKIIWDMEQKTLTCRCKKTHAETVNLREYTPVPLGT